MAKLLLYRVSLGLPVLLFIAVAVFSMFALMPVDPVSVILSDGASDAARADLNEQLGLDRPYFVQLGDWLGGAITGDLGESYFTQRPVTSMLLETLPTTLSLALGGMLIAIVLGISIGVLGAVYRDSALDKAATAFISLFLAIPGFWLALILVLILAVELPIFPVAGYTPWSQSPIDWAYGLVLPCLAVGLHAAAVIARQTRSALIEALGSGYVRSLAARGVSPRRIVMRYGLKNALLPVLAVIAMQTSIAIGVSFVVERIFSMPGMGTLLLDAVVKGDLPLLEGSVLIIGALVLAINIAVDITYGALDPRARPQ